MSDERKIIRCEQCGSDRFVLPDNPEPDDTIACCECGADERYGEAIYRAIKLAAEPLSRMIEDAFQDAGSTQRPAQDLVRRIKPFGG